MLPEYLYTGVITNPPHTHTRLTALFPGLSRLSYQVVALVGCVRWQTNKHHSVVSTDVNSFQRFMRSVNHLQESRITFLSTVGSANAMKCSSHLANSSAVIYPGGLGYPTDPGGVPAISDCDIH